MATRKQLVYGADGLPQQLQPGDTVLGVTDTGQVTQSSAATLLAGNVVYQSGADAVAKAQANAAGTKDVFGLTTAAIAAAGSGTVQCNGILALTAGQWDAVAGTTGGLAFGVRYFLDPATAGKLTATVPTTAGQYLALVGRGVSATELLVEIHPPGLL